MTSAELKNIIAKHNRYASDVMNIKYDSGNAALVRYKHFIDEDAVISEIMKNAREKSAEAPDMFTSNGVGYTYTYEIDEAENLPILYKHLSYMVDNATDLKLYAFKFYATKYKKFNDMIRELLKTAVFPIIQYIQAELNALCTTQEDNERRESGVKPVVQGNYYEGDHYQDSVVQKNNHKATMTDVKNDKSKKIFQFQKESFFLGIVASVVSGLIVWGITALIQHFIG